MRVAATAAAAAAARHRPHQKTTARRLRSGGQWASPAAVLGWWAFAGVAPLAPVARAAAAIEPVHGWRRAARWCLSPPAAPAAAGREAAAVGAAAGQTVQAGLAMQFGAAPPRGGGVVCSGGVGVGGSAMDATHVGNQLLEHVQASPPCCARCRSQHFALLLCVRKSGEWTCGSCSHLLVADRVQQAPQLLWHVIILIRHQRLLSGSLANEGAAATARGAQPRSARDCCALRLLWLVPKTHTLLPTLG